MSNVQTEKWNLCWYKASRGRVSRAPEMARVVKSRTQHISSRYIYNSIFEFIRKHTFILFI